LTGTDFATGFRSISEALDRLVSEARTSRRLGQVNIRSVVGTIDIAPSDPLLETADVMIRNEFETAHGKAKRRGRR